MIHIVSLQYFMKAYPSSDGIYIFMIWQFGRLWTSRHYNSNVKYWNQV